MWPLLALAALCARAAGAEPASVELWVGERRFQWSAARQEAGVRPAQELRVRCAGAGPPGPGPGAPLSYHLYLTPAARPNEPPAPERKLAESAASPASATLAVRARDAGAALRCRVDDARAGRFVNVTVQLYDETERAMSRSARWRVAAGAAAGALLALAGAAWGCAARQRRRARQEFSSVAYADRNSVENLDPRTRPPPTPPAAAPAPAPDPQRLIYAEIRNKIDNNNKKLRAGSPAPAVAYREVPQRDC